MRLSDPRKTTAAEAARLDAEGKTIVMITCSIHATEVASTHTAVEFAYRLLTEDNNPKFKAILDNVIILLEPSQNPDGVDIVTRWYRKTRGTPFDGTSPPELYHHYVGHDDNRDWYIFTQPETRNTAALENKWHPEIVYDVHQMGANTARMFVPPWMDPVDPNIDPILASICNMIGTGMATDLAAAGKTGIAINAMYDFWSPGRQYQAYHGGARILTESASVKLATPIDADAGPDITDQRARLQSARAKLELSGSLDGRDLASARHHRLPVDRVGVAAVSGRRPPRRHAALFLRDQQATMWSAPTPYAFVVPVSQARSGRGEERCWRRWRSAKSKSSAPPSDFTADGKQYRGGKLRDQHAPAVFGLGENAARTAGLSGSARLYPGGPPKRPYDVTAQTLPMLMGVDVVTVKDAFRATLKPATQYLLRARTTPSPPGAMAATDVYSWKEVAKIWKSGKPVYRDTATGDFYTAAGSGRKEIARSAHRPVQSYVPSMDEGWTRWLFDDFGFALHSLHDADVQAGNLRAALRRDRDSGSGARSRSRKGIAPASMPPEYCGGIGEKGRGGAEGIRRAGRHADPAESCLRLRTQDLGVKAKNVLARRRDRRISIRRDRC